MADDKKDPRATQPAKAPITTAPPVQVAPAKPAAALPPSPSLVAPVRDDWKNDAEAYLKSRGWTHGGTDERGMGLYFDPAAKDQKSELRPAVTLPVAGGGKEIISQWHGPPVVWCYRMDEAMLIQRQREVAGETIQDRIARKELELEEMRLQLPTAAEV